ncbi:MAG: type II toxin-antitoxin system RelE/ParE family toxin [Vulcanimicrobiota bacterium]
MDFEVFLTKDASRDLDSILEYLAAEISVQRAEQVLDQFEGLFVRLATFPHRGEYPKELVHLGIKDFRQVHLKPYRIIYKPTRQRVYVMAIADSRRDINELLNRRLLE